MARSPKQAKAPPLADSADVQETFVTDVVGAGVIGQCISINLAVHRWSPTEAGKEPEITRALVSRLVLSREAAVQLAQTLANLGAATRSQSVQAEVKEKPAKK